MNIHMRIWAFVKHEFFQVLPPTIFFLISFNIVVFTTTLVLEQYAIQFSGHAAASILALVIGKVVLVIDKLPFVRRFDRMPLLYPILFKAVVYSLFVFLFRLLEHWIPGLIDTGTLSGANLHLTQTVVWRFFLMAQVWIFVLFLVYFTFSSLIEVFGLNARQLWIAFCREHPAVTGAKPSP